MIQTMTAGDQETKLLDWIDRTRAQTPHLAAILDSFGQVLAERARLRADMAGRVPQAPAPDKARLVQGAPVLLDAPLEGLGPALRESALRLLPVMARAFPAVAEDLERMLAAVREGGLSPGQGMEAMLRGDDPALADQAQAAGIPAPVLRFGLAQIMRPVLECAQEDLARAVREAKWLSGRCPACGSAPDLALYIRAEEEQSEFLRSHGGQRWLRCSLCGITWRFKRMACPECGSEEPDDLEYFSLAGREHERAHACKKCGRYMVGIDVCELVEVPDLDVAALAMLPLDILVQDKGFQPLAVTPWNTPG